jgi:hypothetical protein
MSQELQDMADGAEVEEMGDEAVVAEPERLVRVSEAIRYRRRAQAAERQVRQLAAELESQQSARQQAEAESARAGRQQEWTAALLQEGTVDLEAALLLVERRLGRDDAVEADAGEVIRALRRERPWLFADASAERGLAQPTAGARGRSTSGGAVLRQAAQRAQQSGRRRDVQEYLRLRRSVRG